MSGALLAEGNSATLIEDLKIEGSSLKLKHDTLVRNIRLTNLPSEI